MIPEIATTEQAPLHEIVCSHCGEPLGEFSRSERTRVGRCCLNLPEPWPFPREEESEDEAEECGCWDCRCSRHELDYIDFAMNWDDDPATAREMFTTYALNELARDPTRLELNYFEQLSS